MKNVLAAVKVFCAQTCMDFNPGKFAEPAYKKETNKLAGQIFSTYKDAMDHYKDNVWTIVIDFKGASILNSWSLF